MAFSKRFFRFTMLKCLIISTLLRKQLLIFEPVARFPRINKKGDFWGNF